MALAFYVLGGLLVASGGLLAVIDIVNAVRLGQYAGLVAFIAAAVYVMLAGALFTAIGAIIRRLDRLIANTRPRAPVFGFARDGRETAYQESPARPRREPQGR